MSVDGARADHSQGLHIQLLGGFRVSAGPRAIQECEWRLRKVKSLVKLLALAHEHRLHREQIEELLWPDLEPEAAANNLHKVLHLARRVLEPHLAAGTPSVYLRFSGEFVGLDSPAGLWIDAEAFGEAAAAARRTQEVPAYQAALELYGGDLLPEDRYEDWAARRREDLRGIYLSLLLELARRHEILAEHEAAAEALRRVIAIDPLHEEAHVSLMRLYALAGQRQRAIRQYRQLKETFSRELATEPEPASQQLYREIVDGRFARRAGFDGVAPGVQPAEPAQVRHNLPAPPNPLIGREHQRATAEQLLRHSVRLLTILGPPGIGKTRLAVEVAAAVVDAFAHGVWFVSLAPIGDPALVASAVAQTLGLRDAGNQPLAGALKDHLRDKRLLLVLDNFEQVSAAAPLVADLLAACPHVAVLVTSRAALRLSGEHELTMPPLALPEPGLVLALSQGESKTVPLEQLAQYDSVRLFVERARAVKTDFAVTPENGASVAEICRRLDGLPLAIELASARIRLLSPEAILVRLEQRLPLLTGGSRDLPARQQTLRDAIGWSYDLLDEREQALFRQLGVFMGGWMVEAAEAVCTASAAPASEGRRPGSIDGGPQAALELEVLDGLDSLVSKSLVQQVETPGGEPRFVMLETIREYALERLEASGRGQPVRARHAAQYLALAEQAEPELNGPRQATWLERLEREHDNLRQALAWYADNGLASESLRLAAALHWFWALHGHVAEGRRWLERLLALAGSGSPAPGVQPNKPGETDAAGAGPGAAHVAVVRALSAAGYLAHLQLDYDTARARQSLSLAVARRIGDRMGMAAAACRLGYLAVHEEDFPRAEAMLAEGLALYQDMGADGRWGAGFVLGCLARVAFRRQDLHRAAALFEESLARFREVGSPWGIGWILHGLGQVAAAVGDYARAREVWQERLTLARALGNQEGTVQSLELLGMVARLQGDSARAQARFEEALAVRREWTDGWGTSFCLEEFARLAARDRPDVALRLVGAAVAVLETRGNPHLDSERDKLDHEFAPLRRAVGAEAAERAWAEGRAMGPDEAAAFALSTLRHLS